MTEFQNCGPIAGDDRPTPDVMNLPSVVTPSPSSSATPTPLPQPPGTFLFMDAIGPCPAGESGTRTSATCYLTQPAAAAAVVDRFKRIGVSAFLLPPEFEGASPGAENQYLAQLRILGQAVKDASLEFYTTEVWHWYASFNSEGRFQCATYKTVWIDRVLKPLKQELGAAFAGFHFRDEPGGIAGSLDGENLAALKSCLFAEPEFAGMKVFLNLFPILANTQALSRQMGTEDNSIDLREPAQFGVDCATRSLPHPDWFTSVRDEYTRYATSLTEKVKPDFLAFDLYPFTRTLDHCPILRELAIAENANLVRHLASLHQLTPLSYLQNQYREFASTDTSATGPVRFASAQDLRWFSAFHIAFGISHFANFLSHTDPVGAQVIGLLDASNATTPAYAAQESESAWRQALLGALAGKTHEGFVAPYLDVRHGTHLINTGSQEVLAGEFSDPSQPGNAWILLVRRQPESTPVSVPLTLFTSYEVVERFDPDNLSWVNLLTSGPTITVPLNDQPALLLRFTRR